jgi:hypothetical protein
VADDVHTSSTHPKIALEFEYEELEQQKEKGNMRNLEPQQPSISKF